MPKYDIEQGKCDQARQDRTMTCKKCGEERSATDRCRNCVRIAKRKYKKSEKGRASERRYREKNAEAIKEKARKSAKRPEARAKRLEAARRHRATPEQKQKRREYLNRPEVKERVNKLRRERYAQKYKSDPRFQIDARMRCLIRRSVSTGKNNKSWRDMVDFSIEEFMAHMERQFTEGMSWDEFRKGSIHIDHIVPVSDFKIKDSGDSEFRACWTLANLRPMWASENNKKRAKRVFLL